MTYCTFFSHFIQFLLNGFVWKILGVSILGKKSYVANAHFVSQLFSERLQYILPDLFLVDNCMNNIHRVTKSIGYIWLVLWLFIITINITKFSSPLTGTLCLTCVLLNHFHCRAGKCIAMLPCMMQHCDRTFLQTCLVKLF